MMSKIETILAWVAAVILLQTLFFKFTGAEESKWIFAQLGLEPYGRIGSGVAELVIALGLLFPATRALAALGGLAVMAGALLSHVLFLGVSVKDDGGLLFTLALMVFFISGFIAFNKKDQLLTLLQNLSRRLS